MPPKRANPSDAWRELEADGANLDFEEFLSIRVNRLSRAINRTGARPYIADAGLDTQEWRTLALVGSGAQHTAQDLSARCSIDKATLSRTLLRLRDRKLVRTMADPADARRQLLSLTAAGRRLHDRVLPHAQARQASFLQTLSPADRAKLWQILDRLTEAVETVNEAEAASVAQSK